MTRDDFLERLERLYGQFCSGEMLENTYKSRIIEVVHEYFGQWQ